MNRFFKQVSLCSILSIAVVGCSVQPFRSQTPVSPVPSASSPAPDSTVANRFDPATVKVGDRIQGLLVEKVDVQEFGDSMTGTVAFRGEVTVTGTYKPHPQFPDVQSLCFDVDADSAAQLPRFQNDDRKVWFCLNNQETAVQQLGAIGTTGKATIVIDQYTTIFKPTDVVDGAVLVRVVSKE